MNRATVIFNNLYWCFRSFFWKRDNSIILIGSWFGNRFADTSRYLFQFLADNKSQMNIKEVVWVTRNDSLIDEIRSLGYTVFHIDSKESLFYHKHAGVHILCNFSNDYFDKSNDMLCRYSYGAKRINLWHGVMPMKGVACASNEYKKKKKNHPISCAIKEFLLLNSSFYRRIVMSIGGWGDAFYLTTTPAGTSALSQFFVLPPNHFIETSNPRVSYNPRMIKREQEVINIISRFKKTILYLPTFRGNESHYTLENLSELFYDDFKNNGFLLIEKFHLASQTAENVNRYASNSLFLSSDVDVNIIMPYVDLLITDYSSVVADAVYYNIPVVYYMPDYDEYMNDDRGFIINPKEMACGPIAYCSDELKMTVVRILNETNVNIDQEKYRHIMETYWGKIETMDKVWADLKTAMKIQ